MRTTRERFGIGLGTSFLALVAPARAEQFRYRLGHANPVDFPPHVRLVQMAAAIKRESGGRMIIDVFPNSILGSQTSMIAQLRLGSIQFFTAANLTLSTVVPVAAIDSIGYAFHTPQQAWQALDGRLGAYLRKEFAQKGLYVFEKGFENGIRQMTSSTHPITTASDFVGFKLRTPPAAIYVDFFRTLGASPVALDSNELYTALQTRVVDGQETPLIVIESYRLYEVQEYLSMTNHIWTGAWLSANLEAWNALPPDIQAIVSRNASKYALLARNDMYIMSRSVADKLRRQGFVFNNADTASMRARLGPYYARWRTELGSTAWGLLENTVGRLG